MNPYHSWLFEDIQQERLQADFALFRGVKISRSDFLQHVNHIRKFLPDNKYIINLCEDRYLFIVVFIACLSNKQTVLLPPNRAESEIENLKIKYQDCSCVSDDDIKLCSITDDFAYLNMLPDIDPEQLACIVFTSGSTGEPKPNKKIWSELLSSSVRVAKALGLSNNNQYQIVATVPAQHMFGFEMSVMLPLVTNAMIHSARPFFPEEICHCLSQLAGERILIITPVHIEACTDAGLEWPEIAFVLSATATLKEELASRTEEVLETRVKEIYGCSEAGAIACRNPARSRFWDLIPGYQIESELSGYKLVFRDGQGDKNKITLNDNFVFNDNGQFVLQGRDTDMIKIAGKRGSLGDLRNKICSIAGVEDAVFFMPETAGSRERTAALVIAQDLEVGQILKLLSRTVDPVFLPRPLIKVARIPYNEIGKIRKKDLMDIYRKYREKDDKITRHAGK